MPPKLSFGIMTLYWLGDEGHPVFADRGRKGVTITDRATLERVAMDAIPALRSGS